MKSYQQIIRHSGNNSLFELLDISILGTLCHTPIHLHAEGLRGTGKTTLMRACKQILPKIDRIKGCLYNCDPNRPHCPEHRQLTPEEIARIGVETIDMPFLEISPSAKKGTVVGSIDLKKLTSQKNPEACLLLGTIPKAHRGIIFVDEINRIADISPEIADVLLDVMGTKPGRIQIEETGLPPVVLPVQVTVWAASNPDEDPGPLEDIRRQLSDRFDFAVNVERPVDPEALKQILGGAENPSAISTTEKIDSFNLARKKFGIYSPSDKIKEMLSQIYIDFGLESLRGVEAILLGAKARAALLDKTPEIEDIIYMARFALRHRCDSKSLGDIIKHLSDIKDQKNISTSDALKEDSNQKLEHGKTARRDPQKVVKTKPQKTVNPLERFLSMFKKGGNSDGKGASKGRASESVPTAPPQKAIPLKELELKDYVKTEGDLRR